MIRLIITQISWSACLPSTFSVSSISWPISLPSFPFSWPPWWQSIFAAADNSLRPIGLIWHLLLLNLLIILSLLLLVCSLDSPLPVLAHWNVLLVRIPRAVAGGHIFQIKLLLCISYTYCIVVFHQLSLLGVKRLPFWWI